MSKQSDWGVRVTRVTNGWLIVHQLKVHPFQSSGFRCQPAPLRRGGGGGAAARSEAGRSARGRGAGKRRRRGALLRRGDC